MATANGNGSSSGVPAGAAIAAANAAAAATPASNAPADTMAAVNAGIAEAGGSSSPTGAKPDDKSTSQPAGKSAKPPASKPASNVDAGTPASNVDAGKPARLKAGKPATPSADASADGQGEEAADGEEADEGEEVESADAGEEGEDGADEEGEGDEAEGEDGDDEEGEEGEDDEEDPIEAPIPEELKKRTKARMVKLTGIARDLSARLETSEQNFGTVMGVIRDAGTNAQQYGATMQILKLINNTDPQQQRVGAEALFNECKALYSTLGLSMPGVDPLDGHDDLAQAVQAGQVTRAMAEETARLRNQTTVAARAREHNQQQQQSTQEVTSAKSALNTLEQKLITEDGPAVYQAKSERVKAQLADTIQYVPLAQRATLFEKTYRALPRGAARVVTPTTPTGANGVSRGQQPLRVKAGAGGQRAAPASTLDAVNFGIEQANNR